MAEVRKLERGEPIPVSTEEDYLLLAHHRSQDGRLFSDRRGRKGAQVIPLSLPDYSSKEEAVESAVRHADSIGVGTVFVQDEI